MPSASIQDAVASIIREIIFYEGTERQIRVDQMLDINMQIFMFSSQAQAISHCVFSFLDTFLKVKENGQLLEYM